MTYKIMLAVFAGVLTITACDHPAEQRPISNKYRASVFKTKTDQFGYDIYKDSLLMVHQPNIPVAKGYTAFMSREDALRIADLMIYKLSNGISSPSITPNELDSLKVQGVANGK